MTSESGPLRGSRPWTLLLGPGERLDAAFPLFQALLASPTADDSQAMGISFLEQMEDLGALICEFPESGKLLLDADDIPLEDVGLVRRFCADHPSWELHLLGSDPGCAAARALRELSDARWWPAPLDVPGLHGLAQAGPDRAELVSPSPPEVLVAPVAPQVEHAEAGPEAAPAPQPTPRQDPALELGAAASDLAAVATAESPRADEDLLAQVEAILGGAPPSVFSQEPSAQHEAELAEEEESATPFTSPPAPAPYFKHQVADLADLVQRVDLCLARLQGEAQDGSTPELTRRIDELGGEVNRLKQFARTLSYLAAPPAPGNQRFELAPMIEEQLGAKRAEPGSPRYLLRNSDPLQVRSDKALLAQVLDALLYLCQHLAGEQGTVRVDGRLEEDPAGLSDRVRISIRFHAPDHPTLDPASVLTPYGLRRQLPELGPNALAAAAGILRGQGGGLELIAEDGGGFEWILRLPHAT